MRYRLFGATGLRVSELFLGAMTFGEQGGVGAPPQECARILDAYADAGGNVIDTAINYRGGQSEEILGPSQRAPGPVRPVHQVFGVPRSRRSQRRGQSPREPAAVAGDQPAPAAHQLRRHLLGAYVGPAHAARGNHARPRRRGARREDPLPGRLRYTPGWRPGRTPWRSGTGRPPSPARRRRTTCSGATSSASSCRWPRR